MKTKIFAMLILLFAIAGVFSALSPVSASDCPGEGLPGGFLFFDRPLVPCGMHNACYPDTQKPCTICHLLVLVNNIYNLLLSLLIIVSLLMITIGGTLYILSGANSGLKALAKEILVKTLTGFGIFLLSWLIVYTILVFLSVNSSFLGNGGDHWYEFTCNTDSAFYETSGAGGGSGGGGSGGGGSGGGGSGGGGGGTAKGYLEACPDITSSSPIDYSKAASSPSIAPSSACDGYNFSNSSGVDPKILKAIAQLESSCGSNKGSSSAGACGLMQLLPSTASSLAGRRVTCAELNSNDALSIDLAARYIAGNQSGSCVAGAGDRTAAIFAGYNSGYGCVGAACSPKHALCASSDCPGSLAFECCINPGELDETINYSWNGVGLYSKLR